MNKKFSVISLITLFALVLSPISATAASSSMNTNQKKYVTELFKAFASSDADKIAIAQRKYVSSGSAADKFTNLVKNHHSTTKYFKSINAYGMPSGVAPTPDTKGTYKVGTTFADFNSVVNEFDSYNTKFTFDKKGKIKSWTMAKRDKKSASKLENRINALTSTFNNTNFSVSSGYLFKQPDGDTFLQLLVKNVSGNLKSWSYTGGQYGDSSGAYFSSDSNPTGCLYPGQEAFLEAQVNGRPEIVTNTEAVFEAPTFNGCGAGSSSSSSSIRFAIK